MYFLLFFSILAFFLSFALLVEENTITERNTCTRSKDMGFPLCFLITVVLFLVTPEFGRPDTEDEPKYI